MTESQLLALQALQQGNQQAAAHHVHVSDETYKQWQERAEQGRAEAAAKERTRLRDHFAGLAIAELCGRIPGDDFTPDNCDFIARNAYAVADAMLKARETK